MAAAVKKLTGNVITVFNGNGFVGQNVIARLGRNGAQMVIGYRGSRYDDEKIRIAAGLGQMFYSQYNMKDERSLHEAMKYSNVVINTTGKLNETRNFSFKDIHVDGPRRMARIAREAGVEKFIHFSALNAHPNPPSQGVLKKGSQFFKSKYEGELAVREEFPNAIIFRPADILGDKDSFINHYLMMARSRYSANCALWDYYDGVSKVPIFIQDICAGVEAALMDASAEGKTFQAVGPFRYDFCELIEFMRTCGGQSAKYDGYRITNMRWDIIMRLATTIIERIQKYPRITWERIEKDSTPDYVDPKLPTLKDLGVQLTPIEQWIQVLGHYRPREHRFEIAYESALRIDLPKRMDLVLAR